MVLSWLIVLVSLLVVVCLGRENDRIKRENKKLKRENERLDIDNAQYERWHLFMIDECKDLSFDNEYLNNMINDAATSDENDSASDDYETTSR